MATPSMGLREEVEIRGTVKPEFERILTSEVLDFVVKLHREFNQTRESLLKRRAERQAQLDAGTLPDFLPETEGVRRADWQVAPAPADLEDRRVEITGPVERKMMINALNSGARVFMADFEDALSPGWSNVLQGQINLVEAVRKTIKFVGPEGKTYQLKDQVATLLVRPRGWHLAEKHVWVDRKSTRLNSSHHSISYAVFCLKKTKQPKPPPNLHNPLPPHRTTPPPPPPH